MPMWDAGQAVDREAQNDYLSTIDEAFEVCLQGVETAREAYEKDLESARVALEAAQAQLASSHGRAIDAAWAGYKERVASASSTSRARAIAEARGRYHEASAEAHRALEESEAAARDTYLRAVHAARVSFETAVDGEFNAHRETLATAGKYLEGTRGDHIKAPEALGELGEYRRESYFTPSEPPSRREEVFFEDEDDVILEGINPD